MLLFVSQCKDNRFRLINEIFNRKYNRNQLFVLILNKLIWKML